MDMSFSQEMASQFLDVMRKRYACKNFDPSRKLTDSEVRYLLECGRLSPSSFGLEPWRFIAVVDESLIGALGDACFSQSAVYTSPCPIVILARQEKAYKIDSAFVRQRADRFPGGYGVFAEDYRGYYEFLRQNDRLRAWSVAQAYIACANMMTGAACAGLDSCAIEGFDEAKIVEALGIDEDEWIVALVATFGFGNEEPRSKIRESLSEISAIV